MLLLTVGGQDLSGMTHDIIQDLKHDVARVVEDYRTVSEISPSVLSGQPLKIATEQYDCTEIYSNLTSFRR